MPKVPHGKKVTQKQRLFIEYYLGEAQGNGTKAAKLAGYSGNKRTLAAVGSENLTKSNIVQEIARRRKHCAAILSKEKLQEFWTAVIFDNIDGKIAVSDKLKASELLGKSYGMFIDKQVTLNIPYEEMVKREFEKRKEHLKAVS